MDEPERRKGDSDASDLARKLRGSEERFRLFMENVREYAIFMMDPEGRVTDWNRGAEHVLGYGSEILGQPFSIFFPPEDRQDGVPERELRRAVETGQASDDRWHVRKDGTYFWALGITTAMRDDNGALRGFAKVLRDSTERKHFEEILNERNKALQEADRRKDEFLAVLGHELRNPLAPIFNALAILGDVQVPADAHGEARLVIDRQVRALSRLVDDLLEVSRITRGKIQLRRTAMLLQTVIQNVLQTARPLLAHRGQTVIESISPEPLYVDGDSMRLEQVFVNLLANAAKYSGDNSIIDVELSREHGTALVRVKDSGVGIAPDVLPRLFNLFTQADASLDRSQGGLGIGLALVKSLVELHDGSVQAFSEGLGKGAEFTVRLPLLATSSTAQSFAVEMQSPGKALAPLRVLIVDDNVDAADSLELLLRMAGHKAAALHSGSEAIEAARSDKPQVILLDIGLPGLNGYQVAERLRASPETKDILLIATTGYGQEEARQRAMQSGFDHHLVKPIDPDVIRELLSTIANRMTSPLKPGSDS